MTKLVEGQTYLFNFTKRDGTHRTMLASVCYLVESPIGGVGKALVEELLTDGTKQQRSILLNSIKTVNAVKTKQRSLDAVLARLTPVTNRTLVDSINQVRNSVETLSNVAETAPEATQETLSSVSVQHVVEEQEGALKRLGMYDKLEELTHLFPKKERSPYSFKQHGKYFVVKHVDKEIGKAYSFQQVAKMIEFHKQYQRKEK